MTDLATVQDVNTLYRSLTPAEQDRTAALLPVVSDILRQAAFDVGKDLDEMINTGKLLKNVAVSVTVDIVARCLMTPTNEKPMTQFSQGALGYTVSGTYLVPGGGIFVKKSELSRLGLRRQRVGGIEMYDTRN